MHMSDFLYRHLTRQDNALKTVVNQKWQGSSSVYGHLGTRMKFNLWCQCSSELSDSKILNDECIHPTIC